MEARLKAILEMESSQMQKELIAASNNLKKFERELAKATDPAQITYLQRSIGVLKGNIDQLTVAANGTSKAMANVGGAVKSTTMNSQNFARVLQDLPFGFMGIQNNLTQLIPGVGAAGLAFSALTAAITFSQVGLTYWTKGTKEARAAIGDLTEYTKEFTKNAAEEAVKARLLYEAANNVNIAMDARIRAAKELKSMYPEILANYSAEDIALGKAKDKTDELTRSILANAKAQAARNRITALTEQLLNEQFNAEKIKAITDKELKTNAADLRSGWLGGISGGAAPRLADDQKGEVAILERRAKVLEDNKKKQDALNAAINLFIKLGGGATAIQKTVIPAAEKAKGGSSKDVKSKGGFNMEAFRQKMDGQFAESLFPAPELIDRSKNKGTSQVPQKGGIGDPKYWEKIAQARINAQNAINDSLLQAADIAEYGGQVFGQMVSAMMNGESIGDVLADAFKRITIQIAAAVAQALIFAALLESFPALKGVFGTVGAVTGNMNQSSGGMNLIGLIQGQNIQLSNQRTSTGMGYRRGRR